MCLLVASSLRGIHSQLNNKTWPNKILMSHCSGSPWDHSRAHQMRMISWSLRLHLMATVQPQAAATVMLSTAIPPSLDAKTDTWQINKTELNSSRWQGKKFVQIVRHLFFKLEVFLQKESQATLQACYGNKQRFHNTKMEGRAELT